MSNIVILIIIIIIIALIVAQYFAPFDIIGAFYEGGASKREVEARFLNIDLDAVHKKIKRIGRRVFAPTYLERTVYALDGGYARIRTEPRKVGRTHAIRVVMTSKIYPKKTERTSAESAAPVETEIVLDQAETHESAREFMKSIGHPEKAQHEQYREEWKINADAVEETSDDIIVDIDWLPGLAPSLEIECDSDATIRATAKLLGLDYESAVFGAYAGAYSREYGFTNDIVNNQVEELRFVSAEKVLAEYVKPEKRARLAQSCAHHLYGLSEADLHAQVH